MTLDPGVTERMVTREDIEALYQEFLGRPVPDEGAIIGRLGRTYAAVRAEIGNSIEAQNRRNAALLPIGPIGPQGPGSGAGGGGGGGGGGSFGGAGGTTGNPLIDEVLKRLDGILNERDDLGNQLLDQAMAAARNVFQVRDELSAQLKNLTIDPAGVVGKVVDSLTKQLETTVSGLVPNTLTLMGAALGGVETLLSTFLTSAADLGDIGDLAEALFRGNSDDIGGFFVSVLTGNKGNVAGIIGQKITDGLTPGDDSLMEAIAAVSSWLPTPHEVDV